MLIRKFTPTTVNFESKDTIANVRMNVDPTANSETIDLQMDQELDIVEDVRLRINEPLNYLRNNKGDVPWELTYDVGVIIDEDSFRSRFVLPDEFRPEEVLVLGEYDITGTHLGAISDVYHEMGHYVMYKVYGDRIPQGNPPFTDSHYVYTESNPEFALREGWASFVGGLVDDEYAHDGQQFDYRDILCTNWRGDEAGGATGYENGFESGKNVEGAVSGVLFDTAGAYGFAQVFRVIFERQPDNIDDFQQDYCTEYTEQTVAKQSLYNHLAHHGIVFSRVRFSLNPFLEPPPPNAGGPSSGNAKTFIATPHLRGVVTTSFEPVPHTHLGITNAHDNYNKWVRVKCKPANNGVQETQINFPQYTDWVAASAGQIELDTRAWGDGDWDLLIERRNWVEWLDNFWPEWNGDANPLVDTTEKYLKETGVWYDSDGHWQTFTDDGGKVIIDNTAPYVTGFAP